MTTRANASFEVKSWDEKPYSEVEGELKLTRAGVTKQFHGDIEGESTLEYLMVYRADGSAAFVGMERVIGRVGGRSGSFVLQHSGTDDGKTTTDNWFVVPGSGTGELSGLRGEGSFISDHSEPFRVTFDYDFE
jgi:hypothetical protein